MFAHQVELEKAKEARLKAAFYGLNGPYWELKIGNEVTNQARMTGFNDGLDGRYWELKSFQIGIFRC